MESESPTYGANTCSFECVFCGKSTFVHLGKMGRDTAKLRFGSRVAESLQGSSDDVRAPRNLALHPLRPCHNCEAWDTYAKTHLFLMEVELGNATGYVVPIPFETFITRIREVPELSKHNSLGAAFSRVITLGASDMEKFVGQAKPKVFA